jgi:hypothetical protein
MADLDTITLGMAKDLFEFLKGRKPESPAEGRQLARVQVYLNNCAEHGALSALLPTASTTARLAELEAEVARLRAERRLRH